MKPEPQINARYPLRARVKLSADAELSFPRLKGRIGVVKAYARNGYPKILFDKRRTVAAWHPDLLIRVRQAPQSSEEG